MHSYSDQSESLGRVAVRSENERPTVSGAETRVMAAGPTVGTPATNLGPAGGVGLFSRRVEAPMSEEQRQLQLEYEALVSQQSSKLVVRP